jgi:hypothetical protein
MSQRVFVPTTSGSRTAKRRKQFDATENDGGDLNSHSSATNAVLQLQRTIGNRATQRVLANQIQRDTGAPAAETIAAGITLDAAQVARALSYYRSQPWRYTPAIISQLQKAVGTEETGKISEPDVQGVARWQAAHPPLKPDGMAGPRTLPAMFESGLAEEKGQVSYAKDAATFMQTEWQKLKSAQARADALQEIINRQLADKGIPGVKVTIGDTGGAVGEADYTTWHITVNTEVYSTDAPDAEDARKVVSNMYHEARHIEQYFRIAQMFAGRKHTKQQIQTTDMPGLADKAADVALGSELKPGTMEALIADEWHEAKFHSPGASPAVLEKIRKAREDFVAAKKKHAADPSPANAADVQVKRALYIEARNEYGEAEPLDKDAYRVEDEIDDLLRANGMMDNKP